MFSNSQKVLSSVLRNLLTTWNEPDLSLRVYGKMVIWCEISKTDVCFLISIHTYISILERTVETCILALVWTLAILKVDDAYM